MCPLKVSVLFLLVNKKAPFSEHRDHCHIVIVLLSVGPRVTEKGGSTHPASGAITCQPKWLRHIYQADGSTGARFILLPRSIGSASDILTNNTSRGDQSCHIQTVRR